MMTPQTLDRPAEIARIANEDRVELDVRPVLRNGGEPFSEIMQAAAGVPQGGALRLRATFKPTPLFAVLRVQGFKHWIERGQGDDWIIWFYK